MSDIGSRNKKTVLIVHNYYQIHGGEDAVVANEKKLLEDQGHRVILYTRHNNELKSMSMLRKLLLPFTTVYNPRTAKDITRIIREHKVDIVHVHNTLNLISPSVYYAAYRCGIPVIQTIHNFRFLCPSGVFYRDGRVCEDCVSKGLMCAVRHGCYRGSKSQTLLCVISTLLHRMTGIYGRINYITLTEFNRMKLLQLKCIKPESVCIKPNFTEKGNLGSARDGFVFAGRLDELKGVKILLEAWKIMGTEAPHLIICGTGPLEGWCREQAKNLNVDVKGFLSSAEVKILISRSQALVLPTLWYEGFPMTILEAYSVGTPVICSDIGNAGSIVEEGVTGWKFPTGNAGGLITTIYNWKDISSSVKAVYEEKYTPEANYKQLISIYSRIS